MGSDFYSSSWYRVAALAPRLSPKASISRHRYRGEAWYVLSDTTANRVHRFTPQTYFLLGQMDGRRTLDQIWNTALERLGDDAPTQDELIQLLGQLHAADVIECDVPPDSVELFERFNRTSSQRRWMQLRNPLFLRLPLWDPDRFLEATLPSIGRLFGWPGLLLWAVLVFPALLLVGVHWSALTENLSDRVLATGNLVLLWSVFPVVKLLHELGHAWATKARGGEVHEMGIMFMVFMPIPYVDSTAANGLRSKWARAGIGAAGMLVETALAAVAMFAWVQLEPGLLRAVCFNVLLIAGMSTVVFNINPLLRYDGYYILADLIEMPNLATRSQRWLVEQVDRLLFRTPSPRPMRTVPGEAVWLALYAPLSAVYRLVVMVSIALFVATKFFIIGVALALWAVAQSVVWPIAKGLWHVAGSDALRRQRGPAVAATLVLAGVAALLLFVVPAPYLVVNEGVVWLPDDAQVRARSAGFVERVAMTTGQGTSTGDVVLRARDPALAAQAEAQAARLDELDARLKSQWFTDRVQAEITRQALTAEQAAMDRLDSEREGLIVRTRAAGTLILPRAVDLPGRHLRKGELIGWVGAPEHRLVRVVVGQADIESMRGRLRSVTVRLAPDSARVLAAHLVREVPAARDELPSKALAVEGGGVHAVDPRDPNGLKTLERVFQFDVALDEAPVAAPLGARAWVRFAFEPEPLGHQLWRRVRQAFLSRFDL
ncbi:MAG: hypothetical protein V4569_02605 [Pseudomonadota bacterium]